MEAITVPNSFWKYYDLYRRRKITICQFSTLSGLPVEEITVYLQELGLPKNEKEGR